MKKNYKISAAAFLLLLIFNVSKTFSQDWSKNLVSTTPDFYEMQKAFNKFYENKIVEWSSDDEWIRFKRWEAFMEPRV